MQAALDKIALGSLDDHARHCVMGAEPEAQVDKADELMAAVGRLMRRGRREETRRRPPPSNPGERLTDLRGTCS